MTGSIGRRRLVQAGALMLPAVALGRAASAQERVKSGTVEIEQVQVAFIGSGNVGGGTLHFQGKSYRFTVGGLGVGGFGVSKMQAYGDVFNLRELRQFPGAYGQARYGMAAGDTGRRRDVAGESQRRVDQPENQAHRAGAVARRRRRLHRFQVSGEQTMTLCPSRARACRRPSCCPPLRRLRRTSRSSSTPSPSPWRAARSSSPARSRSW